MASKRVNIAYLTSCGKIYRHQWVSVSRRATSPRLCFRRRLSQPGCSVEIYMVSFRWLIFLPGSPRDRSKLLCSQLALICHLPRNVLLTTGQLPHSQPLAPDRPILVSHTDIVSPYRLTCYWTVAIHAGQSCCLDQCRKRLTSCVRAWSSRCCRQWPVECTLCSEKNTHSHFLSYLHEWCVDLNKNCSEYTQEKVVSDNV